MLPGFRLVIAGLLIAVVLPLIAFGVAASFRSANSTSFSPPMGPAGGPALAEYYWSQFYAPTNPPPADMLRRPEAASEPDKDALPAQAALVDGAGNAGASGVPKAIEPPRMVETPKPIDAPAMVEAAKIIESPKIENREAAEKPEAGKTPGAVDPPRDVVIARLPDSPVETPPAREQAPPVASPAETAPEAPPSQNVAALNTDPAPSEADLLPARPLTGRIPLPAKRPALADKPPVRIVAAPRSKPVRSRPRAEEHFIPFKNSLWESLFGGMGGS